jgi:DNA polymerase-3 subunit gamma/tau
MRDALSVLDRLIASGDTGLTSDLIEQMLGLPPQQQVGELIDALADGDVPRTLNAGASLLGAGIAQDQLLDTLIEQLRQMMLIQACGADSPLVEMSDDARQRAAEQARRFDAAGLVHMIALCENVQRAAKSSSTPRALLDAALVRLALSEKMADVAALLAGNAPAVQVASAEKKK